MPQAGRKEVEMSFPDWAFLVWLFVMGLTFMAHCTDKIVKAIKDK